MELESLLLCGAAIVALVSFVIWTLRDQGRSMELISRALGKSEELRRK